MIRSNNKLINQANREMIIKKLDDSSDNIELEDLFLFDLSPYYEEKLSDSFFSKQLEFIKEKNKLEYNANISFTTEQLDIFQGIINNKRCIVSAPTSFCKTMLIKEYIFKFEPKKVVFIVPTNSLADELLDDFKNLFVDKGYMVFDSIKNNDNIDDKCIFIGTQEKYYSIKDLYIDNLDLFVIDEAYKLTDPINGSREVILNRTFIDTLDFAKKMVLLMPLVNSIIGLENYKFQILKSDYSPVAKDFIPLKSLNIVLKKEISDNKNINLVYFNSPNELEKVYLKEFKSIKNSINIDDNWIQRVEEDFHPEWLPIYALKSGIGIHYGPMPKFIQKKVIDLFKKNIIKNVLATSSIIEGVNTPTKNIYIYSCRNILGNDNLVKFKNLIGRAGRLGKHKVGNVFYWKKHDSKFEQANVLYKDINIKFIVDDKIKIIDLNRDFNPESETYSNLENPLQENIVQNLEEYSYVNVPSDEIINLLNKHGFTINKFKLLLQYLEHKDYVSFLGIAGKLIGTIDINNLNIILDSEISTFKKMVDKIYVNGSFIEKSKCVSFLMEMIYSIIPFKIIPLINFIVDVTHLSIHLGHRINQNQKKNQII